MAELEHHQQPELRSGRRRGCTEWTCEDQQGGSYDEPRLFGFVFWICSAGSTRSVDYQGWLLKRCDMGFDLVDKVYWPMELVKD